MKLSNLHLDVIIIVKLIDRFKQLSITSTLNLKSAQTLNGKKIIKNLLNENKI